MKKLILIFTFVFTLLLLVACQLNTPSQPSITTTPITTNNTFDITNCEHKAVEDPAVAATCTAEGLTQGFHCEKCGYVIIAQTTVDKIPHNTVTDKAVTPTCTKQGLTEGSHCSACETVFVAQQPIAATGHSPVTDKSVAPTCSTVGLTEGSHCRTCSAILVSQNTISKLDHEYETSIFTATCGEDGYTLHKCKCGDSYKDNIVSKSYQHTFPKAIEYPNLQYHNDDTCSVCGLHVIQHGAWVGQNLVRPGTYYYVTETEVVCYGYGEIPDFDPSTAGYSQPYPPDIIVYNEPDNQVRTLIIAPGITRVGNWAFGFKGVDNYFGSKITTVYIADTVTSIGQGAFYKFSRVKNLYKSKNLVYEGSYNFK